MLYGIPINFGMPFFICTFVLLTVTNKYSTDMKKKIQDIIIGAQLGGYTSEQAAQKVLDLFDVSVNKVDVCDFCNGKGYYLEYNQGGNRIMNCPKCKQT